MSIIGILLGFVAAAAGSFLAGAVYGSGVREDRTKLADIERRTDALMARAGIEQEISE